MLDQTDGRCLQALLTVVLFSLLICFTSAQPQLIGSAQPIEVVPGDDVILPCHVEPAQDLVAMTIEWSRLDLDPMFVYLWRAGQDNTDMKNPMYRGRTSVSVDELKKGNMSLKLTSVQLSDRGTYTCFFLENNLETSVELVVAPATSSKPVIKLVQILKPSGSVVLECTSSGWYPEPEVSWMDAEGHLVSAGPAETVRGPDDLYTVSRRVTVDQRHGSTVTCRVHQDRTNQTREAQIWVSDDFSVVQCDSTPIVTGLSVGLAVCILVIIALILPTYLLWNKSLNKNKSNGINQTKTKGREEPEGEQKPMIEEKTEDRTRPDGPEFGETTITVDHVDPTGKSVRLRNNSRTVQSLRGWKLILKVDDSQPLTYTFDKSVVLNTGETNNTVIVYAEGSPSWPVQFNQRVWTGQQPWNTGKEVTVTIQNPEGQLKDRKHLKLKQSKQNRTSSDTRTDIITETKSGRSISLTNQTDQDVDLFGWKLTVCVENREPINHTFKQSFILSPGKPVTLLAAGVGSVHYSSELQLQKLRPWNISDKVDVRLCSPTG